MDKLFFLYLGFNCPPLKFQFRSYVAQVNCFCVYSVVFVSISRLIVSSFSTIIYEQLFIKQSKEIKRNL